MPSSLERSAALLLDLGPRVFDLLREDLRQRLPGGVSVPQFRVLALAGRRPGLSLSEISRQLGGSAPGMSRMVETLVRRGLLVRTRVPRDRRRIALTLTPAGERVLETVRRRGRKRLSTVLAAIPVRRRGEMERTLARLVEVVRQQPAAPRRAR